MKKFGLCISTLLVLGIASNTQVKDACGDFFCEGWIEWCDYVAPSYCAEVKNDPNLTGYFFSDCPTWIHSRPQNEWRGPMSDPEKLETQEGQDELSKMAEQYYKTIHDVIRKYDPNHLILGDCYEINVPTIDGI